MKWMAFIIGGVAALALAGCGTAHYRKSADREAARLIAEKTPAVPNMDPNFTIEQKALASLEELPRSEIIEKFLGAENELERDARVLSLEKALALGVNHSRDYQAQKELLYLRALDLALVRHSYTPIFSGAGNTRAQNQPIDVARAIDRAAGTQTSLLEQDTTVVQQYNVSGGGNVGSSILLRSGAQLANSFSIDFLRFLSGDAGLFIRSSLAATLTQPLLRGFGYKVAMENLTQGERNLLYALRDFTQFRKDFAVRIAQSYYGVLGARDAMRNAYQGYQNFLLNAERGRALAKEGRAALADLGQLEQAALSSEGNWISAVRTYRQNLDQFKLLLGLPAKAKIILDDAELTQLKIAHPNILPEDAVSVAFTSRLDLANFRDRKQDVDRQVGIAANALKPRLDLVVSGNVDSKPGSNNPFDLDTSRARGSAGLSMDFALDRKAERNRYRAALIQKEQAARQLELQEDQLRLNVFESWRSLDQAKRNFEISELGVKLAERRVEEQELRAELGKVTGRELVDAQTALIASRNGRTSALVGHTIARLQFWNNMGILFIKENGQWQEVAEAKPN
ncbi:MAG: TolC family protein [Verrucomicrobia bacterium]|nr:TolC family protein [Verrucomicrobiota bacterium]